LTIITHEIYETKREDTGQPPPPPPLQANTITNDQVVEALCSLERFLSRFTDFAFWRRVLSAMSAIRRQGGASTQGGVSSREGTQRPMLALPAQKLLYCHHCTEHPCLRGCAGCLAWNTHVATCTCTCQFSSRASRTRRRTGQIHRARPYRAWTNPIGSMSRGAPAPS